MRGVTVKQEITQREIDRQSLIVILSTVAIASCVDLFCLVQHMIKGEYVWGFVAIFDLLLIAFVALVAWKLYRDTWSEYVVEVDKSVNIYEFMNKYTIVEREGTNKYLVRIAKE
jgi:hypothetical protein